MGELGHILATTSGGFTIPTVTSFAPASGAVGTIVALTGTAFTGVDAANFNGTAFRRAIAFNGSGAPADFTVDGDTRITVTAPAGAATGPISVTNPAGTATSAASFTVTAPAKPDITKLKPASGKRGAIVTISGSGFGSTQGTSAVKFGSKSCAAYVFWSAAQIKRKVPATAKYGAAGVTLTTAGGTSNARSFTMKR
ncbi:MAG: IPT/TIG domain-containing protein [Actinomycetes bacterium]